jgi:hypothetical protein
MTSLDSICFPGFEPENGLGNRDEDEDSTSEEADSEEMEDDGENSESDVEQDDDDSQEDDYDDSECSEDEANDENDSDDASYSIGKGRDVSHFTFHLNTMKCRLAVR